MLGPIYWAISWILLRWHALWDMILPGKEFLSTNWDWVLAIFFLVVTIRAILFPVVVKQIKSQRAMQKLAPQIKALQEKHKGDRETLQREMMELYRTEKANPLMGCLPMVVQIPVMWSLFHVLRHLKPSMPGRLKTLYGWTAAQFDSASSAKLFGAPISASFKSTPADLARLGANGTNVKIVAGVLVAIMIVTTYMTSRQMILKTGWAEDSQQKMIQRLMLYGIPVSLLVSGTLFPIGVVIYWVTTNLFSLGQQYWVLRKYPPPPSSKTAPAKATSGRTAPAGKRTPARTGLAARFTTSGRSSDKSDTPPKPAVAGPRVGAKPSYPKKGGIVPRNGTLVADGRGTAPKPGAKPAASGKPGTGGKPAASASGKPGNGGKPAGSGASKAATPKKGSAAKRASS